MLSLTQKEQTLLQDQKSHEEMCIKKYTKYANEAGDPELKQLFNELASQEREHLNTVNQILNGQVPNVNSQSNSNNSQNKITQFSGNNMNNQQDADLCQDLLSTEKYVSSTYNTTIFECKDTNVRKALNHIQKEEQEHGEKIYNYMQANGMYS
ncbi:spore coat protein [Senegalia massiliensis]|uniref:Spore coat protein n=1 Tax=Senegalia massiliensis TaxID=1720316 RepID=A0A845R2Q5_9CLOT|nr:spore coat protein [Senegalia massiliensis]NBI07976.1 spore coat protein [Senegalia massiliensis]